MFFVLGVVYHPACIWAGSPSIIQYPQGKGVWAVLVDGVEAPGPFSILKGGIQQHNKGITMSQSLCFNDFTFSPVTRDNQPWFKSSEIASALGYKREDTLSRLFDRNADEFTENMTQVVEISTDRQNGVMGNFGTGRARIFSLRGCHLLAMFARTPVAKAFRRWVLDVIEQYGDRVPVPQPVTLNDATISPAQRHELKLIVDAKVGMVPKGLQRRAYKEVWGRFNRHFQITEYKQLPCSHMDEARDFMLSTQVNAGKVEMAQAVLPAPRAAFPTIDERPFLNFIEEVQSAHEEVKRMESSLRKRAIYLISILNEAISTRAGMRLYSQGFSFATGVHGSLCLQARYMLRHALLTDNTLLDDLDNPAYSLLGIVRQLNGR